MNPNKEINIELSEKALKEKGILWKSFNNNYHWRIGRLDYFPSTLRWRDEDKNKTGEGIEDFLNYLNCQSPIKINKSIKEFSVEQLFQIAAHSKVKSLMGICEAIHKEIYK